MTSVQFQLRNSTKLEWDELNPTLAAGEPGIETDTGKVKFGNGVDSWSTLSYYSSVNFSEYSQPNSLITNSTWLIGGNDKGSATVFSSGDADKWDVLNSGYGGSSGPLGGAFVYTLVWTGVEWLAGGDGGGSNSIALSTNGKDWVAPTSDPFFGGTCYGVAYNGSLFVAAGTDASTDGGASTRTISTSTDGLNWVAAIQDPFAGETGGVAYGVLWDGTQWIAVGTDTHPFRNLPSTKTILISQDGKTWDSPFTKGISDPFASENGGVAYAVAYNGTRYVFAGTNGGSLFYGGTAGTYTLATTEAHNLSDVQPLATPDPFGNGNAYGVEWNGQRWVATGNNIGPGVTENIAPVTAAVSTDGLTWETSDPFNGGIGYGVMWSGNEWVLSGTNVSPNTLVPPDYTVVRGKDGVTWAHNSATDPFGKIAGSNEADNVAYTVAVRNRLAGALIPRTSASGAVGQVQFSDGNGNFRGNAGLVYNGTSRLQGDAGNFIDFSSFGQLAVAGAGPVAYPTSGTLTVIGSTGGSGRMTIFIDGTATPPTLGSTHMTTDNIPNLEITDVFSVGSGGLIRIGFTTPDPIRPPGSNYVDPVNETGGAPTVTQILKFSYFVVGDIITDDNDLSATITNIEGSDDGNTEVITYEIIGNADKMFMSRDSITVTGSNTRAIIQKNVGIGGDNSNVFVNNAGLVAFNVASEASITGLKTLNGSPPFPTFSNVLLPGSSATEVGDAITKLVVPTENSYFAVRTNGADAPEFNTITFNLTNFPIGGTFFVKNIDSDNDTYVNFTIDGSVSRAASFRVYTASVAPQLEARLPKVISAITPIAGFYLCVWDGQMLYLY